MHGHVHPGVQKRFVNFFGEHAFAAKLAQRFVLDPVSRGRDDAQLDVALFEAMGGDQAHPHVTRLPERERATARADAEAGWQSWSSSSFVRGNGAAGRPVGALMPRSDSPLAGGGAGG